MKTGFFQSITGNRSSSRLIGFLVVIASLVFAQEVIWFGKENVIQAALSAGSIFLTIAGPAMAFLFYQKKTETKQESHEPVQ